MARWRLINPHYLAVEGTKWEYHELDRATGRQIRKQYPVPLYLDPRDLADCNHKFGRDEGEIIVTNGGTCDPKDLKFTGDPTPDMLPVDEEAEAISAKLAETWKLPPEAREQGYSQSLIDNMQRQMALLQTEQKPVEISGLAEFMSTMTQVLQQNATILESLTKQRRM